MTALLGMAVLGMALIVGRLNHKVKALLSAREDLSHQIACQAEVIRDLGDELSWVKTRLNITFQPAKCSPDAMFPEDLKNGDEDPWDESLPKGEP